MALLSMPAAQVRAQRHVGAQAQAHRVFEQLARVSM